MLAQRTVGPDSGMPMGDGGTQVLPDGNVVPVAGCGNGTLDDEEPCDGALLGGASCESEGFSSGTLGCMPDCRAFNFAECVAAPVSQTRSEALAIPDDGYDGTIASMACVDIVVPALCDMGVLCAYQSDPGALSWAPVTELLGQPAAGTYNSASVMRARGTAAPSRTACSASRSSRDGRDAHERAPGQARGSRACSVSARSVCSVPMIAPSACGRGHAAFLQHGPADIVAA